jgi:hypothetical protein
LSFSDVDKDLALLEEKFEKDFKFYNESKDTVKDSPNETNCLNYLKGKPTSRSPYKREEPIYQSKKPSPARYQLQDDARDEVALDDALMKQEFWEKKEQEASLKSLSPQRLEYQQSKINEPERPYVYQYAGQPTTKKY